MARGKSIAARQAVTLKENRYWQWRTFKSNYQPQLSLTGVLPAYTNSFREVVQPDGSIQFQPVKYNNSSLSQSIAATGGTIFGTTQMQRYDDFNQAKRDLVPGLRDFWSAYYQLRYLSLYDFDNNKKIIYP